MAPVRRTDDRLVDPDIVAAFRITSLTLIDPHFYTGDAVCEDKTSEYNQIWNDHIEVFEINPTIVLSPLVEPCAELARQILDGDLEGLVLKERSAPYRDGSRAGWWKVKDRSWYE